MGLQIENRNNYVIRMCDFTEAKWRPLQKYCLAKRIDSCILNPNPALFLHGEKSPTQGTLQHIWGQTRVLRPHVWFTTYIHFDFGEDKSH